MATQDDRSRHPAQSVPPRDELDNRQQGTGNLPMDEEHDVSYGPSPVPESPSWAHVSASIAPTAQPVTAPAQSSAVRNGTIAAAFLLGVLTTALLGVVIFAKQVPHPMSAAARFGGPEPALSMLQQPQEVHPGTNAVVASGRRYSGSFTAFDMAQAEEALAESQLRAQQCVREAASDVVEVQIVFNRTGHVVSARVPARDRLGGQVANCMEDSFRDAVISPFEGRDVMLTRQVPIQR